MILRQINNLQDLDDFIYQGRGYIYRITLHWTGTSYDDVDHSDYHVVIGGKGETYVTLNFNEKGRHTEHRNTGNLGIAMACCGGDDFMMGADGRAINWGDYPPTNEQIEQMARVLGYIMVGLGIPAYEVQDHRYYAVRDGYADWRVDIMGLPIEIGKSGRDIIVGKAIWYINKWKN